MITTHCSSAVLAECAPAECRWRCALEVIDELLSPRGGVRGDEMDHLLELRWHLHKAENAESVLRHFCDLRLRMEHRHYLAFFRIRRWLENHLVAVVRTAPEAPALVIPVALNFYCVEAIRRATLCRAGRESALHSPRLQFAFRGKPVAVAREQSLSATAP